MNRTNGYIGIVVLVVVLILGIGIYMIRDNYQSVPVEVVEQVPVPKPAPTENRNIIAAVELFASSAPAIFEKDFVCKGGFINEEIADLKLISHSIVENRIFDFATGQRALNQDEAGISCIESDDNWVLFTALNQDAGNDPYYCADSTGAKGRLGLDTEGIKCESDEI